MTAHSTAVRHGPAPAVIARHKIAAVGAAHIGLWLARQSPGLVAWLGAGRLLCAVLAPSGSVGWQLPCKYCRLLVIGWLGGLSMAEGVVRPAQRLHVSHHQSAGLHASCHLHSMRGDFADIFQGQCR